MKVLKFSLSLLFALFAVSLVAGQDIIVTRDGDEIEAKVVEVTDSSIRYFRYSIPDAPIYNIPRGEVSMILYQNGCLFCA
jgi:hypothetical protein